MVQRLWKRRCSIDHQYYRFNSIQYTSNTLSYCSIHSDVNVKLASTYSFKLVIWFSSESTCIIGENWYCGSTMECRKIYRTRQIDSHHSENWFDGWFSKYIFHEFASIRKSVKGGPTEKHPKRTQFEFWFFMDFHCEFLGTNAAIESLKIFESAYFGFFDFEITELERTKPPAIVNVRWWISESEIQTEIFSILKATPIVANWLVKSVAKSIVTNPFERIDHMQIFKSKIGGKPTHFKFELLIWNSKSANGRWPDSESDCLTRHSIFTCSWAIFASRRAFSFLARDSLFLSETCSSSGQAPFFPLRSLAWSNGVTCNYDDRLGVRLLLMNTRSLRFSREPPRSLAGFERTLEITSYFHAVTSMRWLPWKVLISQALSN